VVYTWGAGAKHCAVEQAGAAFGTQVTQVKEDCSRSPNIPRPGLARICRSLIQHQQGNSIAWLVRGGGE